MASRTSQAEAAVVAVAPPPRAEAREGKSLMLGSLRVADTLVPGRAVDPREPRERLGLYWGFQTRPGNERMREGRVCSLGVSEVSRKPPSGVRGWALRRSRLWAASFCLPSQPSKECP